MTQSASTTVAFLGAGTMGAPMARNLASAGFAVRAWNRTREKADAVDGVEVADSPEEAASGAGAVITMLADASAVEEAMTGGEGALPALEGAPWLQMSTIGLAGTERMKATAAEHEVAFVDAPVLGTKEPAEQAQLLVLASGPEDDDLRGRCQPLFDAVGQKTLWVGEAGAGSRPELVLEAAADLELPFARAVTLQLRRAEACGLGEQDMAAVARMVGPDRGATRAET